MRAREFITESVGSVIDLTKNYPQYAKLQGKILDISPKGKYKIEIVSAEVVPGKKSSVKIGDTINVHKNYIKQSLQESVTFDPIVFDKENNYYHNPFGSNKEVDCWVCKGTGKDSYGKDEWDCDMCGGKGKKEEWVSDAPELNVSNSNAFAILDMLGVSDPDYAGKIQNKDLPAVMRKLIMLKNKGAEEYTEPGSISGNKMQKYKDPATGLDRIGRQGPMMYHMGRSSSQVERYIDKLLEIIKFAQQNNADLGWG